jgi:hypothetical protein
VAFHDLQVWNLWEFSTIKVLTFRTRLVSKCLNHKTLKVGCEEGSSVPLELASPAWEAPEGGGLVQGHHLCQGVGRCCFSTWACAKWVWNHSPGWVLSDTNTKGLRANNPFLWVGHCFPNCLPTWIHTWSLQWRWGLENLASLASNHDPSDLSLPSTLDYSVNHWGSAALVVIIIFL